MNLTPEQIEAIQLVAPYLRIPALIAGFAALRKLVLLAGVIGGKQSKEYRDAQDVCHKTFGSGFEPSSIVGSTKSRSPRDDR